MGVRAPDTVERCWHVPVGRRAVSPVVAVVLLLGLTVALGLALSPVVFGTFDDIEGNSPEVTFGLSYEEAFGDVDTDEFGTSTDAADGLVTVRVESDSRLDPGNIEVRAPASGGNLLTDTGDSFDSSESLEQGEEFDVVASRGDTIEIIWTSPDRGRSSIIAELVVPTESDLPPGVPTPTLDCDWVTSNTDGDGDLVARQGQEFDGGDVVACDSLAGTVDGTLDIEGDLSVIGSVDTTGPVTLTDGSFDAAGDLYGAIDTDDTLTLEDPSVTDEVTAGGNATLDNVSIEDTLTVGNGTITDSTVDSDISTESLTLDNTTVTGDVSVSNSLECRNGAQIAGEDCSVYRQALFDIVITGTSWPGVENETFRVIATAENDRIDEGTRTVQLDAAGGSHDPRSVTLAGGAQTLLVLEWDIADGDAGEHPVTVETNESAHDDLDAKTVEVLKNTDDLPTVETFTTSTGGDTSDSIAVDWNVTAGASNLSAVTVDLFDSTGAEVGSETWFSNGEQADGSVEFTNLAAQNHTVTLEVSDQGDGFVSEVVPDQQAG